MPDKATRNALLNKKAASVTRQLERWVKQNNILKLGEQIAFTLYIKSVPIVTQTAPNDLLTMKPLEFFTKQRFRAAGVQIPSHFVRLTNMLRASERIATAKRNGAELSRWELQYPDFPTMQNFVALTMEDFLRIPEIGRVTIDAVERILLFNGIPRPKKQDG